MSYSRRELYALGESLGDSATYKSVTGKVIYGGGGKGKAPPAPDYTGAANATAAGNLEAARAASAANRVNQYTPYGNLIYQQTPTFFFWHAINNSVTIWEIVFKQCFTLKS